MTDSDGARVRAGQLIRGFKAAYHRFQMAQLTGDSEGTFHAVFEALNWTVALTTT